MARILMVCENMLKQGFSQKSIFPRNPNLKILMARILMVGENVFKLGFSQKPFLYFRGKRTFSENWKIFTKFSFAKF